MKQENGWLKSCHHIWRFSFTKWDTLYGSDGGPVWQLWRDRAVAVGIQFALFILKRAGASPPRGQTLSELCSCPLHWAINRADSPSRFTVRGLYSYRKTQFEIERRSYGQSMTHFRFFSCGGQNNFTGYHSFSLCAL